MSRLRKYLFALALAMLPMLGRCGLRLQRGHFAIVNQAGAARPLLQGEVDALKACPNVVGFCYTQITDVEQEKNGIYYYDRQPKFDAERLKAIFECIPSVITDIKQLPIYHPAH